MAALPVLDAALNASNPVSACNNGYPSTSPCPEWTPPPPDTRTPEQVLRDQDEEMLQDSLRHLTRHCEPWEKRYAYGLWGEEYARVLTRLHAQRIAVTEVTIDGQACIIGPNGNIVRRINQLLYLAR